jgi:class 3 adenylate cyclase/pimeloyl-ACP methyl ester carboxylesterase
MEPQIQYATTQDNVSIAFWTLGEGVPLVHLPWFRASHVQLEWQFPECRRWYEALASKRNLVRYDSRGVGMSFRNVSNYSLDALVSDLEAVVDKLDLERFALFGVLHNGPVAIAYAARNPGRVSHLVLWCTYARSADYAQSSQIRASRSFTETDWHLYTETLASIRLGWSEGESTRRFAALVRESLTPESLAAQREAFADVDVSGLLPQVEAPTLVMHRRGISWLDEQVVRDVAARIPNASLQMLEGASGAPYLGDTDSVLSTMYRFLGETYEPPPPPAQAPPEPTLKTILFTDVEGSTALTQRLGDEAARDIMRDYERITREALATHGGAEVKTMGDGFMATFGSATRAVECAVALQGAFESWNSERGPEGEHSHVRIGLNAGEPIAEDEDLFGTAVIVASRIADQAKGGEILASNVVRELVAGKRFEFASRGRSALRGFDEPVEVYEIRWR